MNERLDVITGKTLSTATSVSIGYETELHDVAEWAALRRFIASAAIAVGTSTLLFDGLYQVLARDWATTPSSMSYEMPDQWDARIMAARCAVAVLIIAGGVLLLRRRRLGIVVIRWGVLALIALAVISLCHVLYANDTYRSYWSTPATLATNTLDFVHDQWLQIALICLTLNVFVRRLGLR